MKLKTHSALIIIDQQKGIDNPKLGARNNSNAQIEISNLLPRWRELNWPIVHVKHRSTQVDSVFWPEQEGFDFKPEFLHIVNEFVIEKQTPCAFTNTNLQHLLIQQGIQSIVVVGASTNNSVEATVRAGGCLGFNMIVIENACFAFAKADYFGVKRSADEVHAISLANLNDEYAHVLNSNELVLV